MLDERKTARRIVVHAFTIETSFSGAGGVLSDDAIWRQIGAKVAEGRFHLLGDTPLRTCVHAELARDLEMDMKRETPVYSQNRPKAEPAVKRQVVVARKVVVVRVPAQRQ
jgi:hypothetical protein